LYVRKIDTENNQVVLTPEDRLFSRRLIAEDFNWIWCPDHGVLPSMQSLDEKTTGVKRQDTLEEEPAGVKRQDAPKGEPAGAKGQRDLRESPAAGYTIEVTAKPRYRAKEAGATATVLADGKVEILFHEPQRALTVGQAVVVYRGENVVGGGTICATCSAAI
jgi:tRNA U34 2-thiouridine synthase MnmA/TrmU